MEISYTVHFGKQPDPDYQDEDDNTDYSFIKITTADLNTALHMLK